MICRERLTRILAILTRHPHGLSVRQFTRTFSLWNWEIQQAAELGFVKIETRKPRTGRPALIVSRVSDDVSETQAAKLPPFRWQLPKPRRFRHQLFALHCTSISPARNTFGFDLTPDWRAYRRIYPHTTPASARACASRLRRHPEVRACRQWFFAKHSGEVPPREDLPATSQGIWQRFRELGCWRARFAPFT